MAKARKTRQQKIKSELRRRETTPTQATSSVQFQLPVIQEVQPTPQPIRPTHSDVALADYKYLSHDLMKTTITVSIVLVIEILLRILFQNA